MYVCSLVHNFIISLSLSLSPEIKDKTNEEIINGQLDIKLGHDTKEELIIVLKKLKTENCGSRWNSSGSMEDK